MKSFFAGLFLSASLLFVASLFVPEDVTAAADHGPKPMHSHSHSHKVEGHGGMHSHIHSHSH